MRNIFLAVFKPFDSVLNSLHLIPKTLKKKTSEVIEPKIAWDLLLLLKLLHEIKSLFGGSS